MEKSFLPEIKTERLLLRRLKKSDWKMISYLRSDEKVNEFVERPKVESQEKALGFISKINRETEIRIIYYWVVTEKVNDQMIGSICLWNFSEDQKIAEVGYDLSPKYQRKGIMDESLKAVIEAGFGALNFNIIEAYTHELNESSRKMLERNGFILIEGKKDKNNEGNVIYELKK
ncbi:MAG: ribosomal-protein-alanine N-acetyltransferase [Saprospiraceae bacterium]|jgi:ribosomal-protein-alanine N-acetyltransferase